MTKRLVGVGVVIAVLAVNGVERPTFAQVISSGAQPRQSSPPPAGRIGSSRPSPAPLASRPRMPSPGSVLAFRPVREHRVFPVRVPWFGVVYVDSTWWPQSGVSAYAPPPMALTADDRRPVGGLQLDVEPRRASVYVDGWYVGHRRYLQRLLPPSRSRRRAAPSRVPGGRLRSAVSRDTRDARAHHDVSRVDEPAIVSQNAPDTRSGDF